MMRRPIIPPLTITDIYRQGCKSYTPGDIGITVKAPNIAHLSIATSFGYNKKLEMRPCETDAPVIAKLV